MSSLNVSIELLINTAITAPKAGGKDDVLIEVVSSETTKAKIIEKMKEISKRTNFHFYERDALSCKDVEQIIFVCAKKYYHGYNCGYCGFATCEACSSYGGVCALSITDCGIAMGSLVKLASILGIDNRIMLSLGQAAIEAGVVNGVFNAYGIPLYISSKNIFFDRKS